MTDIPLMPSSRRLPFEAALLVLLTLCMAALTAPRVFRAPLWGDELRTWRDGIEKPLIDVLLWHHNADHAPLGHLLARGGAAIFGVERPWSMRLGAWLCGVACVPAIYRLGKTLDSDLAGLMLATLVVVDPNIVFQSTQARMYPPLLLAAIIALTSAAKMFSHHQRMTVRSAVSLFLALTVGLWSHSQMYAVLVPVLITAIALSCWKSRRRVAIAALIAIACALITATPGILKLLARRSSDPLDDEEAARPFAQLEDATHALTGANWLTGLLVACAIAGLVVIARRHGRAVAWMLAGVVVMSVVDLLIAARYRPVGYARYLTVLQPALWSGVAAFAVELGRFARASLSAERSRVATVAIFVAVASLCGFSLSRTINVLPPHPVAGPFRDTVRAAVAARSSDERIIVLPRSPYAMFARYYGLTSDDGVFDVVAPHVLKDRGRRPAPTTAEAASVADATPVTIIGVIPARGSKERTAEDPLAFARTLASTRGVKLPDIPTPDGTLRVIVVRFEAHGTVEINDPARQSLQPRPRPHHA